MINTILFDLDGTLLDTLGDLTAGVNFALSRFSFSLRTKSEIRSFIGNGVPTLIRRSLPDGVPNDVFCDILECFTDYYLSHIDVFTKPYDGIKKILSNLSAQGYNIGIVSNKKDEAVKLLCESLLKNLYSFAIGSKNESDRKPNPTMILESLAYFKVKPENALYVGDSNVDIQTASNSNLVCISVCWGYRDFDELVAAGGTFFVRNTDELFKKILTLSKK